MTANDELRHNMLLIQALDPNATIKFNGSDWYVSANIDISDGAILSGVAHWDKAPEAAARGYLEKLQNIGPDEHVVTYRGPGLSQRREHCWNGAAWQEVTTFKELHEMAS